MNILSKIKEKFKQNLNFKNYLVLITGTSIVQFLGLASYPFLTRLYSPEDFGVFAVYLSIVVIIAAIATGKFEQALVLPKFSKVAFHILILCLGTILFSSLFFLGLVLLVKNFVSAFSFNSWCYLIPVGALLSALFQTLTTWQVRVKKFKNLSQIRIIQSLSIMILMLSLSFVFDNFKGLILGNIAGMSISNIILIMLLKKDFSFYYKSYSTNLFWYTLKKYRDFPKYSIFSNWLNIASKELPNLVLAKFFGQNIVGQFSLAIKLMNIPRNMLGSPFGEVFYQNTAEKMHYQESFLKNTLNQNLKRLFILSTFIALPFFIFGPDFFQFVLGEKWNLTGNYTTWLAPWLFFVFIFSPISHILNIKKKLHIFLIYNIFLFSMRLCALIIGGVQNNPDLSVQLYSLASTIPPLIMIFYIYKICNNPSL